MYDENDIREDRELRNNPPEFESGQDSSFEESVDPFASFESFDTSTSGGFDNNPFGGGGFGGGFNSGFNNGLNGQNQNDNKRMTDEEMFFAVAKGGYEAGKKTTITLFNFLTKFYNSFKTITPVGWFDIGHRMAIVGLGVFAFGVVLNLLSFFSGLHNTIFVTMVGFATGSSGVVLYLLTTEAKVKFEVENGKTGRTLNTLKDVEYEIDDSEFSEMESELDDLDFGSSTDDDFFESSDDDEDLWDTEEDGYDDDEDDIDYGEDDEYDFSSDEDGCYDFGVSEPEEIDYEEAESALDVIDPGTQTRKFLIERYSSVLRHSTPNFSRINELDEDSNSDVYVKYETIIRNRAKRDEVAEPTVEEVGESPLLSQIKVFATKSFKPDIYIAALKDELSKDKNGKTIDAEMDVIGNSLGNYYLFNVIKGNSPIVTIKDAWKESSSYFEDINNRQPVHLGVTELGEPVNVDLESAFSLAVSGQPGKGKTFMVYSILAQLAMYNSPKELNFIIADPKGVTGDFKDFNLPHVIAKVDKYDQIVEMLRWVVDKESIRRQEILKNYNLSDIKDLHKHYPDVELPYLYIVIEELNSLNNHINNSDDKELKSWWKLALADIVLRYRYLGIKLIALAQRFKGTIGPDIRQNMDVRLTAGSEMSEIQDFLDIKSTKDFPYNIQGKVGRYAIRAASFNSGNPSYMKGSVISLDKLENTRTLEFIKTVWKKLEPEYKGKDIVPWAWVSPDGILAQVEDNMFDLLEGKSLEELSNSDVDLW